MLFLVIVFFIVLKNEKIIQFSVKFSSASIPFPAGWRPLLTFISKKSYLLLHPGQCTECGEWMCAVIGSGQQPARALQGHNMLLSSSGTVPHLSLFKEVCLPWVTGVGMHSPRLGITDLLLGSRQLWLRNISPEDCTPGQEVKTTAKTVFFTHHVIFKTQPSKKTPVWKNVTRFRAQEQMHLCNVQCTFKDFVRLWIPKFPAGLAVFISPNYPHRVINCLKMGIFFILFSGCGNRKVLKINFT